MSIETTANIEPMRLLPMSGPPLEPIAIKPSQQAILGRSAECSVELPDATVSRRHGSIHARNGRWLITDLGSRHGTYLNTTQLEANQATTLENEDTIRIGPWMLRVLIGEQQVVVTSTIDADNSSRQRVERVHEDELSRLAQHRLNLLLDSASEIHNARGEDQLSELLLRASIAGTGFPRAALLRAVGSEENVEVLAWQSADDAPVDDATFSRSLVRAAARGETVRLSSDDSNVNITGQSIVSLRITEALCVPIMSGDAVQAFLYLDSRESESDIAPDAAGFCQALARMGALAFNSLKRIDLQRRATQLETELGAARQAQQLIMPAFHGSVGPLHYALANRPGRFVAGDLFEILTLDDASVAVSIGDVSGEGVGAAILMVATQSHLNAALATHPDPVAAVKKVNEYICARSAAGSFVSLWLGIFHPDGRLEYVDAGHGHWIQRFGEPAVDGSVRTYSTERAGGIPLGIDHFDYTSETVQLSPGDRIILYSDGINEQSSPEGEEFGSERVDQLVKQSPDETQDVAQVIAAVEAHAGQTQFGDDTTIASVRFEP